MRVLGVDPGSRATGWAVLDFDPGPSIVEAGVLRPPTSGAFSERLGALHRGLLSVLDRFAPHAAAVERVFSGINPQSLIALGEARGVLILALSERSVPVHDLTPAEIKRAVTGTGLAEKEQVRRMVTSFIGRRLALDAADAAAAALTLGFLIARRSAVEIVRRPSAGAPSAGVSAPRAPLKRRPAG